MTKSRRISPEVGPWGRRWGRTIAGIAASLFLGWQSIALFDALSNVRPTSWATTAFVAWAFSLMVTGTFAFVGFVLPTHRVLPSSYYKVHDPKRLKRIYRALSVDLFRRALLATLWRSREQRARFFDGSASGLDDFVDNSRGAEFGHAIPFLLLTVATFVWAFDGALRLGLLTALFNIFGNLYPVILQRHHRMRIQRVHGRVRRRGVTIAFQTSGVGANQDR